MKKFTLLLSLCLTALMVSQKALASSYNVSGSTLTVNSDAAGYLAGITKTSDMKACTTIVLIGKFNSSDLSSIQGSEGFYPTTVDMGAAQFEASSASYYWFKESASGIADNNTNAYVGGKLYQLSTRDVWNEVDGPVGGISYIHYDDIATRNSAGVTPPSYAVIPKYMYCQMHISSTDEWLDADNNHDGAVAVDWLENEMPTKFSNYSDGAIVKVKRYYRLDKIDDKLTWSSVVYPTAEELIAARNNNKTIFNAYWVGAIEGSLEVNEFTGEGDYIFFEHYFKRCQNGTRTWINDTDATQSGATMPDPEFDYSARNSNTGYSDAQWVRMKNGDAYYHYVNERNWNEVNTEPETTSMTGVSYHYDTVEAMNENATATDGQYAIVGGTKYVYTTAEPAGWNPVTEASLYDYSQVKFSYWRSTIQTAICPTSGDVSQYPSDMLQDCSSLTSVDFGNINATITGSSVTFSADANTGTVNKSDLNSLFSSHGSGIADNKTYYYGDNINVVNCDDYYLTFSGSANDRIVVVTSKKTGSEYASLTDYDAQSTNVCKTLKFVGNFKKPNDHLSGHTTIDFKDAIIEDSQNNGAFNLSRWTTTAQKLIFKEGEATISAADGDGVKTVTILADTDDHYKKIKNRMTGDTFTEGTTTGTFKYVARQKLTIDTNYDGSADPKNLVIGSLDTNKILQDDSPSTLSSIVTSLSASEYQIITFADGSVYNKSTGVLDCSNSTNMDYDKLKTWIESSGATVSTIKLGLYVSIVNGVTVIDNTTDSELGRTAVDGLITENLSTCTNLTNAEKKAIRRAENLKLKGKFVPNDFLGLKNAKTGADANQVRPTKLDLEKAIISSGQRVPDEWKSSVTEIIIPEVFYNSDESPGYNIPEKFCEDFDALEKVVIPSSIKKVGDEAFRDCHSLTTVDWGVVEEIGKHAFERCGFSGRFDVPSTVKIIDEDAFRNNYDMTYLYFLEDSQLEHIEEGAFFNDERYDGTPGSKPGLKEVHVECNRFIWCHKDAFDDAHTNGHSDVGTAKCRLFYPEVNKSGYISYTDGALESNSTNSETGNDSFQDYVGDFKAECFNDVMTQRNLNDLKTIVETGSDMTVETYNEETGAVTSVTKHFGPYDGHGWYMFTSTGIGVSASTTWRTYSEAVAYKVPRSTVAKFYLVWGYDKGNSGFASNSTGGNVKLVQMKPGDVVPANTGILINYVVGESGDFNSTIVLDYVKDSELEAGQKIPYDNQLQPSNKYTKEGGLASGYTNYLRKINNEPEPIFINNLETDASDNPTYRNFFFGNVEQLDAADKYWGDDFEAVIHNYKSNYGGWMFLRSQPDYYKVNNKAYLHLPAALTDSESDFSDRVDERESSGYDSRLIGMIITDGNDESEQTFVENVKLQTSRDNANCIYTLQGQKVITPVVKGFYIYNGKKIIVK